MKNPARASAIVAVCLSLLAAVLGQTPVKLADYLNQHPWNAVQSGPMIVLDATRVTAKNQGLTLGDFARTEAKLGDLTAIVPTQMTVYNDDLNLPTNPNVGVDISTKFVYLLSTLNEDQWKKALGDGIGLGDLDSDQQKIYLSLLPDPFDWESHERGPGGTVGQKLDSGTLNENDREQVRIQIHRRLGMALRISGSQNSYGFLNPNAFVPQSNDPEYVRAAPDRGSERYGTKLSASVKNVPKKSDLDYHLLTESIPLTPSATVAEIIGQVGVATHLKLYADPRVGSLTCQSSGTAANAGDLLEALALAVTGTYRKVGDSYVLTSDLVGIGTRSARVALWTQQIQQMLSQSQGALRLAIGKKGQIFKAKFNADDPLIPNDTVLPPEDDSAPTPNHWVSSDSLPAGIKAAIQQASLATRSRFDTASVALTSDYEYGFILPDGKKLRDEGSLGRGAQFHPIVFPRFPGAVVVDYPPPGSGVNDKIAVQPKGADEARKFVDMAARKGMTEIWVETVEKGVLAEALTEGKTKGVAVRLLAHPWSLRPSRQVNDPDRTILGGTGPQDGERQLSSATSADLESETWIGSWEEPDLSPDNPRRADRWSQILDLAQTPGLAGVVLLNTSPPGYAATTVRRGFMGETSVGFGYTLSQRLRFLAQTGVDPIDLTPPVMGVRNEVSFFPNVFPPGGTDGDPRTLWDQLRIDANSKAISELTSALAEKKIDLLIESGPTAESRLVRPWGSDSLPKRGRQDGLIYFDMSEVGRKPEHASFFMPHVIGFGTASPADAREAMDQMYNDK